MSNQFIRTRSLAQLRMLAVGKGPHTHAARAEIKRRREELERQVEVLKAKLAEVHNLWR
jgi:hypothetical protein